MLGLPVMLRVTLSARPVNMDSRNENPPSAACSAFTYWLLKRAPSLFKGSGMIR